MIIIDLLSAVGASASAFYSWNNNKIANNANNIAKESLRKTESYNKINEKEIISEKLKRFNIIFGSYRNCNTFSKNFFDELMFKFSFKNAEFLSIIGFFTDLTEDAEEIENLLIMRNDLIKRYEKIKPFRYSQYDEYADNLDKLKEKIWELENSPNANDFDKTFIHPILKFILIDNGKRHNEIKELYNSFPSDLIFLNGEINKKLNLFCNKIENKTKLKMR